jgi:Fe-S cluster assembly iron-binding protein IscA
MKKAKDMVTITQRAAQELKAIQAANAKDKRHVLRIDTESEGFSLWLGPKQKGDTVVGSEDTVLLRATPDLAKFLRETSVVIDCMDHEEGTRLIVYPEDDPPPELSKPKKTRRTAKKPNKK